MIKENKEFIKSILIVLVTEAFLYFIIKTFIHNYNVLSPSFNYPLLKDFVFIYNSWYPFLFITAFLQFKKDKELYKKYIYTMFICIIASQITFLIYPTMVIRPEIEIESLTDAFLSLTYYLDTPAVNCVPSVHCLLCFISMYYISLNKNIKLKYKISIIIYFILIILSTIFIHQHLLIDMIIAFLYAVIGIILVKIFYPQIKRILNFIF